MTAPLATIRRGEDVRLAILVIAGDPSGVSVRAAVQPGTPGIPGGPARAFVVEGRADIGDGRPAWILGLPAGALLDEGEHTLDAEIVWPDGATRFMPRRTVLISPTTTVRGAQAGPPPADAPAMPNVTPTPAGALAFAWAGPGTDPGLLWAQVESGDVAMVSGPGGGAGGVIPGSGLSLTGARMDLNIGELPLAPAN
jgi:hypothetical protein